ncbi:MAG: hydrogenase maturation protease [Deltaproteobacteria bacterium]|nr:hydrogenase maturation protease [Deltaproteobacteria bacterium]
MKTLILGMGNPILSDDGVGLHVARALDGRFAGTDVRTSALIGLGLLDIVADYDQVFVIDAIQDGSRLPGTVVKLAAGEGALHLFSSHGMHFFEILQLGKDAGIMVPEVAGIYGVVIGPECPFGEGLSPLLARLQAGIVRQIGEELGRGLKSMTG